MKKIEYTKPAVRVRQLYLEGSVMDGGLPTGSPGDQVDPEGGGAWSKDGDLDDFEYPTSGSVWGD